MAQREHKMSQNSAKKYESVILYLAKKLGGEVRGKKKLAKLLYFVDFDFFEKFEKPITGDRYKRLPMGPFPEKMPEILSSMVLDGMITIAQEEDAPGLIPTEVYKALKEPQIDLFSEDEKKMLDRVVDLYGGLSGHQLEILTHAEAPFIGTEEGKEMMYELSFYRGTDFATT